MNHKISKWLRKSPHSVGDTLDRLECAAILTGNIIRFGRVDQQVIAQSGGYENAKPIQMLLMENRGFAASIVRSSPEAAFNLPIRILAWEDNNKQVWIKATDPKDIGLDETIPENEKIIAKITDYFSSMLDLATSTQTINLVAK